MLISLCTPVMNRLDDLRQVMHARIAEANASPPVELCILDCGSTDGLPEYMDELIEIARLVPGSSLSYNRIERDHWHMAKARNMSMLMGQGEYLDMIDADDIVRPGYIEAVRNAIDMGYDWGYVDKRCSIIFCKRDDFISIGGYDERFEFYGPEDRDIQRRLRMLLGTEYILHGSLIKTIYTPDDKKVANYRIKGTKHSFSRMMRKYFMENTVNNILVANSGQEWGTWTV